MFSSTESLRVVAGQRRVMTLVVDGRGHVEVRVPYGTSQQAVSRFVAEKSRWIARQQARAQALAGEICGDSLDPAATLLLFGEPVALEVGDTPTGEVVRDGRSLRICPELAGDLAEALDRYLVTLARDYLAERVAALCAETPSVRSPPAIKVRRMRSRWGSCASNGRLCLNSLLVGAPPACIDGVILHELAHQREMNHSARFYRVLARLDPAWKERRRELNRLAPFILRPLRTLRARAAAPTVGR